MLKWLFHQGGIIIINMNVYNTKASKHINQKYNRTEERNPEIQNHSWRFEYSSLND